MELTLGKKRYVWDNKRGQPAWETDINTLPLFLVGIGIVGAFGLAYWVKKIASQLTF